MVRDDVAEDGKYHMGFNNNIHNISIISPNPIRTHDRTSNPNRPTSDICHSIDIGSADNLCNNV